MSQLALDLGEAPTCSCCGRVARAQTCQPCRAGQHVDHRSGAWDYANPSLAGDPTYCPCPCR